MAQRGLGHVHSVAVILSPQEIPRRPALPHGRHASLRARSLGSRKPRSSPCCFGGSPGGSRPTAWSRGPWGTCWGGVRGQGRPIGAEFPPRSGDDPTARHSFHLSHVGVFLPVPGAALDGSATFKHETMADVASGRNRERKTKAGTGRNAEGCAQLSGLSRPSDLF